MNAINYNAETVSVADLLINGKNPRKISDVNYLRLKKSIEDFPEMLNVRPIVFRVEGGKPVVIGGNQRLRAVSELGWYTVPAINVTGWTDARVKEFMIKDNNVEGHWDKDMLLNDWDLELLKQWGDFESLTEFEKEFDKYDNSNAEMPIVPIYNERYGAVIIVLKTESEIALAETLLNLTTAKCYKTKNVGKSFVIDAEHLSKSFNRKK